MRGGRRVAECIALLWARPGLEPWPLQRAMCRAVLRGKDAERKMAYSIVLYDDSNGLNELSFTSVI